MIHLIEDPIDFHFKDQNGEIVSDFTLHITPTEKGLSIATRKNGSKFGPKSLSYSLGNLTKILDPKSAIFTRCVVGLGPDYIKAGYHEKNLFVHDNFLNLLQGLNVDVEAVLPPPEISSTNGNPYRFFEEGRGGSRGGFIPRLLADEIEDSNRFFATGPKSKIARYLPDKGYWTFDGEAIIRKNAYTLLEGQGKRNYVEEAVARIRDLNYKEQDLLDSDPTKIVFANGVFDLTTYELTPFDHELYALNGLPVTYDPEAQCPKILAYLDQITSSEEDKLALQEWIGYHLVRGYPYQKAMMLLGDGANGKSTFLNLLIAFLGQNNISNVELYSLVSNRFSEADLYGKLGNLAPDISDDELKRTGKFKALTGGDRIRAEYKGLNAFHFVNYAKLSFSANKLPMTPDTSPAFFRRWLLITFPFKFEGSTCNTNLLEEITTEEELSGLLNWGLLGLKRLRENNSFTISESTIALQQEYLILSDPIRSWISCCLSEGSSYWATTDDVYNSYFQYCEASGFVALKKRGLTTELKPRLPSIKQGRLSKGNRDYIWKGIKLNCFINKKVDRPDCPRCPSSCTLSLRAETTTLDSTLQYDTGYKVLDNPDILDENPEIPPSTDNKSILTQKKIASSSEKAPNTFLCDECGESLPKSGRIHLIYEGKEVNVCYDCSLKIISKKGD